MANIKRVRVVWTGGGVTGPSTSTFYFANTATGFCASLQTLYNSLKAFLPDDVTCTVQNTGDLIRDTDGVLQGVWTDSGGGSSTGGVTTAFLRGAGFRVQWLTAGIRNGRRQIGETFFVPAGASTFGTDGFVLAANLTTMQTAVSTFVSAVTPNMLVWGKPHSKLAADGVSVPVVSGLVRSEATALRSRRV